MARMNSRYGILAALVLTAAGGCATLENALEAPTISLANVSLTDVSLTSQSFLLDFDVDNPNPIPLPVSAVNYAVELAGQQFASGATADSFTVPANGAGSFQVAVNTNLLDSARVLSDLVLKGGQRELAYGINGDVEVDLPFARPLPFSHSGVVSVER